jgi:hypothetical protein
LDDNEVLEERRRAAEDAAELERLAEAGGAMGSLMAQADDIARMRSELADFDALSGGALRSSIGFQAAEIGRLRSELADFDTAAGGAVRSIVVQADEIERLRSSIGFQADMIGAVRSALELQTAQIGGTIKSALMGFEAVGTLRSSLAVLLAAQIQAPLRSALDFQAAQISQSLSLLGDGWRAQLTGPLQSLAAFELAHTQLAMQSILPSILTDYPVQPEADPLVAVAVAVADAGAAVDTVAVTVDEPARRTPARSAEIVIMLLVVLLLLAIDLTLIEMRLSPEERTVLKDLIENIGFFLAVASICRDIRKR